MGVPKISDRKLRLFCCALEPMLESSSYDEVDDWAAELEVWMQREIVLAVSDPTAQAALLREIVGNPFRPLVLPSYRVCRTCRRRPPDQWWNVCPFCSPALSGFEDVCEWLTPTVRSLAHAAYEDRGRPCGNGCVTLPNPPVTLRGKHLKWANGGGWHACPRCAGSGRIDDGALDPARLAVLSDALEEAGCPAEETCPECEGKGEYWLPGFRGPRTTLSRCETCPPLPGPPHYGHRGSGRVSNGLLPHLRSPGPHVRGCWALDLILGKE
jgi:hypothetical protein